MAPKDPSQTATTDDSFQRASQRILKTLADHPRASRGALLGLVLAVAAISGSLWLSRSQARQAGYALVQAFALKDAPIAGADAQREPAQKQRGDDDDQDEGEDDDDETMDALPDDTLPQFADQAARNRAAYDAFVAVAHEHPGALGTVAALEAIAVADSAPAVAAGASSHALLAQTAAKLPANNGLLAVAALRQAQLAEDAGDPDGALDAYGRIVAAQMRFLGDEAQLQRARLLMEKGDLNAAREALEDVQNNYPQTHMADEMRIQMAALDAQLSAETPQPPAAVGTSAG